MQALASTGTSCYSSPVLCMHTAIPLFQLSNLSYIQSYLGLSLTDLLLHQLQGVIHIGVTNCGLVEEMNDLDLSRWLCP